MLFCELRECGDLWLPAREWSFNFCCSQYIKTLHCYFEVECCNKNGNLICAFVFSLQIGNVSNCSVYKYMSNCVENQNVYCWVGALNRIAVAGVTAMRVCEMNMCVFIRVKLYYIIFISKLLLTTLSKYFIGDPRIEIYQVRATQEILIDKIIFTC